jgi:hypothetical protein
MGGTVAGFELAEVGGCGKDFDGVDSVLGRIQEWAFNVRTQ